MNSKLKELSKLEALQYLGKKLNNESTFVGCDVQVFALTSIVPLELAKELGLKKDHKVLEIGAGCLRVGHHFINYLDNKNYFAIEPNELMFKAGKSILPISKDFSYSSNEDYNFETFDTKFDLLIAFSIWSHAPKKDIIIMLDEFCNVGNENAKFIATFINPTKKRPDYFGDTWVGISHKSNVSNAVGHSKEFFIQAAEERGLRVDFPDLKTCHQDWAIITK